MNKKFFLFLTFWAGLVSSMFYGIQPLQAYFYTNPNTTIYNSEGGNFSPPGGAEVLIGDNSGQKKFVFNTPTDGQLRYLYDFSTGGSLRNFALELGIAPQGYAYGLCDNILYFYNSGGYEIYEVNLITGNFNLLATSGLLYYNVRLNGCDGFYRSGASNLIYTDINGDDTTLITGGVPLLYFTYKIGSNYYFANGDDGLKIYKANLDFSTITKLSDDNIYSAYYIENESKIYYHNSFGQVKYLDITDDTISSVLTTGQYPVYYNGVPGGINGSCGTSALTYPYGSTSFTGSLCTTGTASPSSPTFPSAGGSTTWSCLGSDGGTNATCYASQESAPVVNGFCGTSAKTYLSTETNFTGSLCTTGTASPSSPTFPSAGNTVSWNCQGSGGGLNDNCIAYRQPITPVNGVCGTNARVYEPGSTGYGGSDFCIYGTASPSSPTFPSAGNSVTWLCNGINGGNSSSCTSTLADATDSPNFWGWSGIIDKIGDIGVGIGSLVVQIGDFISSLFDVEYLGFNFSFDNFIKIFSLNLDRTPITPANSSCENILSQTQVYYNNTNTYSFDGYLVAVGGSTGTYPSGLLDYIPTAQTNIFGSNQIVFYSLYGAGGNSGNTGPSLYGGAETFIVKKTFPYLTGYDQNIIVFNQNALNNLRIVPFELSFLGVNVTQKLETFFKKIMSFVLELLVIPINMLNIVSDIYYVSNIDYSAGNFYCFAGGSIKIQNSFMGGTLLNNVINYTNENKETFGFTATTSGAGGILYVLTLGLVSLVTYRRLFSNV